VCCGVGRYEEGGWARWVGTGNWGSTLGWGVWVVLAHLGGWDCGAGWGGIGALFRGRLLSSFVGDKHMQRAWSDVQIGCAKLRGCGGCEDGFQAVWGCCEGLSAILKDRHFFLPCVRHHVSETFRRVCTSRFRSRCNRLAVKLLAFIITALLRGSEFLKCVFKPARSVLMYIGIPSAARDAMLSISRQ